MEPNMITKEQLEQLLKAKAEYDSLNEAYEMELRDLEEAYKESLEDLNKKYAIFLELKAKFEPASQKVGKKSGERHDQMCPLCSQKRHKVDYKKFTKDGQPALRITVTDDCTKVGQYIVTDGQEGKFPLTDGQIAGVYKTHGLRIKQQ